MIEHAIYSILSNDAGVSAITTRIYPIMLPQNAVYPAISYQVNEDTEDETFDGQGTFQRINLEVDAWSDTHADMLALADAIKAAIKNYSGTVASNAVDKITIDSAISVYEDQVEKYRKTLIATIFKR